jgi:hypothetical protein
VPGTFNPRAADEFMPNTTGDVIRLTAGRHNPGYGIMAMPISA